MWACQVRVHDLCCARGAKASTIEPLQEVAPRIITILVLLQLKRVPSNNRVWTVEQGRMLKPKTGDLYTCHLLERHQGHSSSAAVYHSMWTAGLATSVTLPHCLTASLPTFSLSSQPLRFCIVLAFVSSILCNIWRFFACPKS